MPWQPKKTPKGKLRNLSLLKKLRKDKLINDQFEVMLNSLSLEEVIGLKLELASNSIGGKLYGLPLWHSIESIAKDAILKYIYSAANSKMEAARYLGINIDYFNKICKKYDIKSYFSEETIANDV